jgi:hypothetical protein
MIDEARSAEPSAERQTLLRMEAVLSGEKYLGGVRTRVQQDWRDVARAVEASCRA